MADSAKRRATYQDVLDAPETVVAEIIGGELHLSPRPGGPHTKVASALGYLLGPPFDFGQGGPGGWIILVEPELHVGDEIVVPDLAGWRVERMPEVTTGAYFTIPPDWVCEVLSRSTAALDRADKLPVYAAHGVGHAWLVDPGRRTLEVLRRQDARWLIVATYHGDAKVRAEPFDAIELDLALLWARIPPPLPRGTRASEAVADYDYEY